MELLLNITHNTKSVTPRTYRSMDLNSSHFTTHRNSQGTFFLQIKSILRQKQHCLCKYMNKICYSNEMIKCPTHKYNWVISLLKYVSCQHQEAVQRGVSGLHLEAAPGKTFRLRWEGHLCGLQFPAALAPWTLAHLDNHAHLFLVCTFITCFI